MLFRSLLDPVGAELVEIDAEVLDPAALRVLADRVAQAQAAPNTRRAYAATYRQLETLLTLRLGRPPTPADLTPETVAAFRDTLEAAGRQPTTIARHLAAVRQLLDAAGADPAARRVRGPRVGPTDPRPLTEAEYARLLAMPDRRTVRGRRDLAILYALGDAGLRRSEAVALDLDDVVEVRRFADPRLRPAVAPRAADHTSHALVVRRSKRGRSRQVPLSRPALEVLRDWYAHRPATHTSVLFVSLPRCRGEAPAALSPDAIGDVVVKYATAAGVPADRRTPHVLRHTFCTLLAARGTALEVIAELAGHADLDVTRIYVQVADDTKRQAIHATFTAGRSVLGRVSHPLA